MTHASGDAACEAQGMLQAQIDDLQDKLARAMIVDKSTLPTDRVEFVALIPCTGSGRIKKAALRDQFTLA